MDKKGMELTMSTIIVAVVLLIVAIVLIAIFNGNMTTIGSKLRIAGDGLDCPVGGAQKGCPGGVTEAFECGSGEEQLVGNYNSRAKGKVCCCVL